MSPEEINQQKQIEAYSAAVNAWLTTSLEHDKSIFTLSSSGIALLITLITTIGVTSKTALVAYLGAISCFIIAAWAVLLIFKRNQKHIENILSGRVQHDRTLLVLDRVAIYAFGIGVVFMAALGFIAAVHSYDNRKEAMTIENQKSSSAKDGTLTKSFNDFTNIFNNVSTPAPVNIPATPTPAPSSQPTTPNPPTNTP